MAASFHPRTRRLLDRVGPSIRLWRRAQGLTAEQVADRAGISRPTLRMIETHPERVTFGNVLAVLAVLGVDDAVVAAIDLGIKARTPWQLAERGVRVHVLPQSTVFEEVLALHPDGVFFSNGPGDPGTARSEVEMLRGVLDARIPFFGICLGNQIFGRALGYGTYKLDYGHRGVNQPVLDRTTGRVEITAHNHGFAVDAPICGPSLAPYDDGRYGRVEVSHVGLNDNVVEGLRALDLPAFSVQFHPEAAAGPHDGEHLFDRFVRLMTDHRAARDGRDGPAPETAREDD